MSPRSQILDLAGCLRGEKRAWDAFVERAAPIVFAAVQRVLRARNPSSDKHLEEDVAQDVFLRLVKDGFRLLRSYDPARASLSTWLSLVARSAALDHLRRKRLPTVPLDEVPQPAATDPRPAEPVEIPPALLSPRQHLVLQLLFERDLSVQEAAEALGVDPQTIRSTKHKAIARLRGFFDHS